MQLNGPKNNIRSRNLNVGYYWAHEQQDLGLILRKHVKSELMLADIGTKL